MSLMAKALQQRSQGSAPPPLVDASPIRGPADGGPADSGPASTGPAMGPEEMARFRAAAAAKLRTMEMNRRALESSMGAETFAETYAKVRAMFNQANAALGG